ncbi:MAG: hypothetical protein NVS3B10_12460 [Polyangiales bacterium]
MDAAPPSPYRDRACTACRGRLEDGCSCQRCGAEPHVGARRVRQRFGQRDHRCPRCHALLRREGTDQSLLLAFVVLALAYLSVGMLQEHPRPCDGGGYGTMHSRASSGRRSGR